MTTSSGRPRYLRPPVVEAVLELQFLPPAHPWDTVFLGKIHDRLLKVVDVPNVHPVQQAVLSIGAKGVDLAPRHFAESKRFASPQGGLVLTVGPNMLGVSILPAK